MSRENTYNLRSKLRQCWETAKNQEEAHGRIIQIAFIGRWVQEVKYSDGFVFHIDEMSGCSGLSITTRVYADGDYYIDIDHDNDTNTAFFKVTKDNYATTLFQVNENGSIVFANGVEIDADGKITGFESLNKVTIDVNGGVAVPTGESLVIGSGALLSEALLTTEAIALDVAGTPILIGSGVIQIGGVTVLSSTLKGVTGGNSHDHSGGDGGQIDHGSLAGLDDGDHNAKYLAKDNTGEFTPDGDYEPATKKYVDDVDFIGIVKMYNGAGIADVATRTEALGYREGDTVPERPGWYVCNGQSETPNLLNKFIRSESASGNTGGEDEVTLEIAEMPSHRHDFYVGHTTYAFDHLRTQNQLALTANGGGRDLKSTCAGAQDIIDLTGGGVAHENKPAYYSLIFIIKMT